mmetsp:Transcript_21727/g.73647  ORF Transcript_21727/g.73647 Transcript_21727/m.73647 type:complete len:283 (-) Transcript_21727:1232-2080(-)
MFRLRTAKQTPAGPRAALRSAKTPSSCVERGRRRWRRRRRPLGPRRRRRGVWRRGWARPFARSKRLLAGRAPGWAASAGPPAGRGVCRPSTSLRKTDASAAATASAAAQASPPLRRWLRRRGPAAASRRVVVARGRGPRGVLCGGPLPCSATPLRGSRGPWLLFFGAGRRSPSAPRRACAGGRAERLGVAGSSGPERCRRRARARAPRRGRAAGPSSCRRRSRRGRASPCRTGRSSASPTAGVWALVSLKRRASSLRLKRFAKKTAPATRACRGPWSRADCA